MLDILDQTYISEAMTKSITPSPPKGDRGNGLETIPGLKPLKGGVAQPPRSKGNQPFRAGVGTS